MTIQQRKILIVDDEEAIGQIMQAGLEKHGFTVKFEAHSINAIQVCLDFHPDLVLLDVDMPHKDGGQVAAELKDHPQLWRTPVLFLTSLASRARLSVSGEVLLSKPISIASLVSIINLTLQPPPSP